MLVLMGVLLVLEESMLMLFLLLMAHVLTVILLAQPALEDFTLNAQSAMALLLLWLMQMNVEECVLELTIGDHQTIHVSHVLPLVLIASGLELMIVAVV
jgi:hypothetical protein